MKVTRDEQVPKVYNLIIRELTSKLASAVLLSVHEAMKGRKFPSLDSSLAKNLRQVQLLSCPDFLRIPLRRGQALQRHLGTVFRWTQF